MLKILEALQNKRFCILAKNDIPTKAVKPLSESIGLELEVQIEIEIARHREGFDQDDTGAFMLGMLEKRNNEFSLSLPSRTISTIS